MGQGRHRSPKPKHSDRIKEVTLWLSLGAAIVKFVQAALSFFHGDK
jgi:hypothetical protein